MAKADYYKVLGVERNATPDEMKKAYRALAMKYHPDRNPGDATAEQKFKELNEAYDILRDEQKKAAYDRYGHSAFEGGMGGGGRSHAGFDFGGGDFSDIFSDLFGDFMGGGRAGAAQEQKARGSDLRYNLEVSLEEAFKGKQQTIKFASFAPCQECKTTGSAGGSEATTCGTCRGIGRVRAQQGFFTVERTCSSCHGSGKLIKNPCKSCHGEGRVRKEKSIMVNIPAGVENGTRIRLAGEGEAGARGAPSGDLYIFVSISTHSIFVLDQADIHCKVPIKMTVAVLGGSIEVPTIDGTRSKVTISAGTQTGDRFRLKGKGMSIIRSKNRGDMYIQVGVETPVNLSKKQKELLEEFDKIAADNSAQESVNFFKKVKKIWGD